MFAVPLPRVRRPGPCCCPAAGPTGARRCGSSARRRPTCCRWPAKYPTFPILLEATRECLNDVFDLPALREVLADLRVADGPGRARSTPSRRRRSPSRCCSAGSPSTCTRATRPLAERRAAALALDRDLLRDLLGAEELRELLDPDVLADLELELQRLVDGRRARDADEVHDLLRRARPARPRPSSTPAADGRRRPRGVDAAGRAERRAIEVRVGGEDRLRGGRGRRPAARRPRRRAPARAARPRSPSRSSDPLDDLVARFARTHGPFLTAQVRRPPRRCRAERVRPALDAARGRGPGRAGRVPARRRRAGVVRRRRAAPAAAPVAGRAAPGGRAGRRRRAGPLPARRGRASAGRRRGLDALVEVARRRCRARRCRRRCSRPTCCRPACAGYRAGRPRRAVHRRRAGVGRRRGRSAPPTAGCGCVFRDQAGLLRARRRRRRAAAGGAGPRRAASPTSTERGASFWPELVRPSPRPGRPTTTPTVLAALWDLVWAGLGHQRLAGPAAGLRRPARPAVGGAAGAPRPAPAGSAHPARPAGRRRAGGRWWRPLLEPRPSPTEAAHARARQLLERYGVLTREAALGEGVEGGFAGVYPVLKALEERGQVRRGYFVAGLGAAQFALPGAVDRLRACRDAAERRRRRRARPCSCWPPPTRPSPTAPPCRGPSTGGRPGPGGRRPRRARRRRARCLPRAGRPRAWSPSPAAAERRLGRRPRRRGEGRPLRLARDRQDRRRARPRARHADALRAAGFVDGYKGLVAPRLEPRRPLPVSERSAGRSERSTSRADAVRAMQRR